MGLWDKLTGEFVDIIEWTNDDRETLAWRFERYGNEIKYGAKLTVRPGQAAVFVNEGQIADVFEPGMYELQTNNLPILSTLKGWKYGFESPFKAEVIFVTTSQIVDRKWGTKNPVMLRDPEFGPIRLRAFGTYAIKVVDPRAFITTLVGTDGAFEASDLTDQLRNIIVSRFTDKLGESKIPALDLASNYDEIADLIQAKIEPEFKEYGVALPKFLVENIALPPEVEEALDKRSSMGILGNLNQYTQFQAANAMEAAASNTGEAGGAMGGGMGMGMGFAMANQMGQAMGGTQQNQQASAPPPPAPGASNVSFHVSVNGESYGPYDMNTFAQHVQAGQITGESMVWRQGMANWSAAGQVAELANLFGPPTPPPMPGGSVPPPPPM
ncbi:SPFH domain-containing protein [Lentisphaera profundi]|uniref:SPFH domain-containing protein n=1 Tax=Lentisphaera profundi TaxID=1658616 RepID=A0ABY7VPH4_9BACT|nr:SPFH domain-containing protein [Lentisphaera profundi]WDE96048.1 SPFH domain-containing protein [Lentisphaera profundi]